MSSKHFSLLHSSTILAVALSKVVRKLYLILAMSLSKPILASKSESLSSKSIWLSYFFTFNPFFLSKSLNPWSNVPTDFILANSISAAAFLASLSLFSSYSCALYFLSLSSKFLFRCLVISFILALSFFFFSAYNNSADSSAPTTASSCSRRIAKKMFKSMKLPIMII